MSCFCLIRCSTTHTVTPSPSSLAVSVPSGVSTRHCITVPFRGGLCGVERFYHFYYASEDGAWEEAGQAAVPGLCTEGTAGNTYTGVFLGLFTVGGPARFSGFEMQDM